MAKTLKDFLNERQLGPMVVKNPDEQKFIDKHVVAKTDDRNGNDDELFKGSKVKMADRKKDRKGYNPGEDEEVYEELKGGQKNLDVNHNGELDAEDFKRLRNRKKKVAEEAEELDELSHGTLRRYRMKAKSIADQGGEQRTKGRELAGRKSYGDMIGGIKKPKVMAKEEAEQIDELSKETVRTYYNKAGEQGKKIADKMKMGGGDWSKDGSDTKTLKKRAAGRTMALKRRSGEIKMSEDSIDEKMSTHGEKPGVYGGRASSAKEKMIADFNKPKNKNEKPNRYTKEDSEQIDEVSAATKDSYAQKAGKQLPGLFKKSKSDADAARTYYNRKNTVRKIANEEADQIDEILDTPEKAANYKAKAQKSFSKNVWISGDKAAHQTAKKRLYGLSHPKVAEEIEIEEKLNMDKASMGTVIKDFQKSDAPQFMGKSQKKRQVMAIAAKLSAERVSKPLNKEERLLTKLADISETHQRTMVSVFEKLNEDNQYAFMQACDTADGIEQMLDFSISYRGE
jgi:hypothetical protein